MDAPAPDTVRMTTLGDYVIARTIGEGGMGTVYEATEPLSGRQVALKVMRPELTRVRGARERFEAEMRITAQLDHPNVVRCLACSEIDGKLVIVLELLDGRTLRDELLRVGRLPPLDAVRVAAGVCAALGAAHSASPPIVHRDLKPENLMLLTNGSVKVMDFGIAKSTAAGPQLTGEGVAIGSARYMSPEQAESLHVSPSTDLYSLGVVLYEMLLGAPPFDATSPMAIMRMHLAAPPPPFPEALRATLPPGLERLVMQLLEKEPARRPPSAEAVLSELHALSASPPPAAHAPAPRQSAPIVQRQLTPATPRTALPGRAKSYDTFQLIERYDQPKRWPWIVAAAVVALAALGGLGAWILWPRGASKTHPTGSADDETATRPAAACDDDACVPFHAADPSAVEMEAFLGAAKAAVSSVDPKARLAAGVFTRAIASGKIDLTRSGNVHLVYTSGHGQIVVTPHDDGIHVKSFPNASAPAPPASDDACNFKRAWDLASSAGAHLGDQTETFYSVLSDAEPSWVIKDPNGALAIIDAKCALTSFVPPKR